MDQDPDDDPGHCPDRSGTIAIYHPTISCISHGWCRGTLSPFPLSPLFSGKCILFRQNWKPCEVLIVGSSRCNSGPTTHSPLLYINRYGYDSCLYMPSAFMTFYLSVFIGLTSCFAFLDTHYTHTHTIKR